MTSSNGNIFRVTGHLCGEFTGHRLNSPHNGQWRGALMFSLIWAWINGWANNRDAGDLRSHRANYDVTVMCTHKIKRHQITPKTAKRESHPYLLGCDTYVKKKLWPIECKWHTVLIFMKVCRLECLVHLENPVSPDVVAKRLRCLNLIRSWVSI